MTQRRIKDLFLNRCHESLIFAVLLTLLVTPWVAANRALAEKVEPESAPYRVVDGQVDPSTYLGWRVFHSTCHLCHGVDATGSSVAPDLTVRLSEMAFSEFTRTVLMRYPIVLGLNDVRGDDRTAVRQAFVDLVMKQERGELIMPGWEHDPKVKPHIADLYAYLKARADGVLGTGRPLSTLD